MRALQPEHANPGIAGVPSTTVFVTPRVGSYAGRERVVAQKHIERQFDRRNTAALSKSRICQGRPALLLYAGKDEGQGGIEENLKRSIVSESNLEKKPKVDDRRVIAAFSLGTLAFYALIVLYDALRNGVYVDGMDILSYID